MKRYLLILIVTFLADVECFSQFGKAAPADSNATWVFQWVPGWAPGLPHQYMPMCFIPTVNPDTLINSFTYKKFWLKSYNGGHEYYCSYRVDTVTGKAYIIPRDSTSEYEFFDFSVSVGDTIPSTHFYFNAALEDPPFQGNMYDVIRDTQKVTAIQYEPFGNDSIRSFKLEPVGQGYSCLTVTERIVGGGSAPFGPLPSFPFMTESAGGCVFEDWFEIICYSEDGTPVFPDPHGEICISDTANYDIDSLDNSITELTAEKIKLYPNPTSSLFRISGITNADMLLIFDLSGKLVFEQPFTNNMDVQHLETGTYLVVIKKEERSFRKLLVVSP